MRIKTFVLGLVAAAVLAVGPAAASLTSFATFVDEGLGVSTDGFGSTGQTGTISAEVPLGATVVAAYLYTSFFSNSPGALPAAPLTTLGGTGVTFGAVSTQSPSCCGLSMRRADVTAIVKPVIDGGAGGVYDFALAESSGTQDGEALVVVFKAGGSGNPVNTVGILDGFSVSAGDSTAINFSDPLDPTAPGFLAEMRLGIGFSCCGQRSSVTVNGTLITENAGNHDDGLQEANGSLFTMGGFDDPFSPLLPSYAADHERYNPVPNIDKGDTTITVNTKNPSGDDNIFVAVFLVTGEAGINEPPPNAVPLPGTLALLGLGMLGLAMSRRRRS